MKLVETIKQQAFFKDFVAKKESGNLLNSTLFFCEDDCTSSKVLVLAALLLEYDTFDMFDETSAEFLRIEEGIDLDVKVFPKNGQKLLVSDANEIVSECFVKPVNLPKKIFIINNIDVSTDEAQNKLLKVLEEPPKGVYFLISAKSEERVLPTIKSRCDKIKINPLSKEEIEKVCLDELACVLGGGYIGQTLALARNESLAQVAKFAVSLLTELKSSKQVIKFSKTFLDLQGFVDIILKVLCMGIEDIIKLKCESEDLVSLEMYKKDLKEVEPEFSVEALCEISKLISKFIEKKEFNTNLTVAVDNLLLKMLEVKYLCK